MSQQESLIDAKDLQVTVMKEPVAEATNVSNAVSPVPLTKRKPGTSKW